MSERALWLIKRGADPRFGDQPFTASMVHAAREARGLTHQDIGEQIGVEGFQVRAWEMGIAVPLPATLDSLADVTDFPLRFFFQQPLTHIGYSSLEWHLPDLVRCSECQEPNAYLCDYTLPSGQTCDRPLCEEHAWCQDLEADRDYCPQHGQRSNVRIGVNDER